MYEHASPELRALDPPRFLDETIVQCIAALAPVKIEFLVFG
jgi:hypothetical protein